MAKLKSFTQAGSRMAHGTQSASDTRAILQYMDTVLLDAQDGRRPLPRVTGFPIAHRRPFLSRAEQGSLERGVEYTRDGGYLLVTKLSERCQWPVVLEDAVPSIVLVKHNADRRVQRGREVMADHERGRDGIANIVLERVTRLTSDL